MKSLVKTAAVTLAVAGISGAIAAPYRTTAATAITPQLSQKTGLSFEDLRVGSMGKVAVEIGSIVVPVRVAGTGDNCSG